MARRAAKIDANQPAIVRALRSIGATVHSLAAVGRGCPDIVVGWHGVNYLLEIKDGDKIPSKRVLTPLEQEWHDKWRGEAYVVESVDDALNVLGVNPNTVPEELR